MLSKKNNSIEMPFAESNYANIDSLSIHFRLWEPKNFSHKIVFVHGMGGSTFSWRKIYPYFSDSAKIVSIDLPGFGYSGRERNINHSTSNRAKWIWQILDSIDSSANDTLPWTLVGHSMGGSVIAAMGAQKPEKTRNFVYVDGCLFQDTIPVKSRNYSKFSENTISCLLKTFLINKIGVRILLRSAYASKPNRKDIIGYLKPFKIKHTTNLLFDMARAKESYIDISKIKNIPSTFIWGDCDKWIDIKYGKKAFSKTPNSEMYIIEGAGHCPMETHPDLISNYIKKTLK
ncbi:MAG: alpha/beta hydrolase [Bacteroidota bacterium]